MRVNVITLELPLFKCRRNPSVGLFGANWQMLAGRRKEKSTSGKLKRKKSRHSLLAFSWRKLHVELYTLRTNVPRVIFRCADVDFLSFLVATSFVRTLITSSIYPLRDQTVCLRMYEHAAFQQWLIDHSSISHGIFGLFGLLETESVCPNNLLQ